MHRPDKEGGQEAIDGTGCDYDDGRLPVANADPQRVDGSQCQLLGIDTFVVLEDVAPAHGVEREIDKAS